MDHNFKLSSLILMLSIVLVSSACVDETQGDKDTGENDTAETDTAENDTAENEEIVLDQLYPGPCKVEKRERIQNPMNDQDTWYTYNQEGQVLQVVDYRGVGTEYFAKGVTEYTYTAAGILMSETARSGNLEHWDSITNSQYNEDGQVAVHQYDSFNEEEWADSSEWTDWESSVSTSYDDHGNVLQISGSTTESYVNTYSETGLLLSTERDIDRDGTIDETHQFTWDTDDLLTEEQYRIEATEGTGSRIYQYDDNDRQIGMVHTYTAIDKEIDEQEESTYYASGQLQTRHTESDTIEGGSYKTSSIRTETFSETGTLLQVKFESTIADGIKGYLTSYTMQYNDAGQILYYTTENFDFNLRTYHYDDFGNLLQIKECNRLNADCMTVDETCCNMAAPWWFETTYHYICDPDDTAP